MKTMLAAFEGVTVLPGADGPYLAAALIALRTMARAREEDFWSFLDRARIGCDVHTVPGTYGVGTLENSYHNIGVRAVGGQAPATQAELVCSQFGVWPDIAVRGFCELAEYGKDDAWPFLSTEQSVWKIARHLRNNLPDRASDEYGWIARTLLQALAIPYLYLERGFQGVPSLPGEGLAAQEIARLRRWRALLPSSDPARRRARLIPRRGRIESWRLTVASIFAQAQELGIPEADLVRISRRLREIWKMSKLGYDDLNRKARHLLQEQGDHEDLFGGLRLRVACVDYTNAFILPQLRRRGCDIAVCSERGGRRIVIQSARERARFTEELCHALACALDIPPNQVILDRHSGTIGIGGFPSRPVPRITEQPYDLSRVLEFLRTHTVLFARPITTP